MNSYTSHKIEDAVNYELDWLRRIEETRSKTACKDERITARKSGDTYHYYGYTLEDNTHRSLPKEKKLKQIQRLCQSEYNERLERAIRKREKSIKRIQNTLRATDPNRVIRSLHPGKQQMIGEFLPDDAAFADRWATDDVPRKEPPERGMSTERGELVRSKSEVLIANKLLSNGIPYRYEPECTLSGATLHPDFTVLNTRTRQEFVWEHFGMADNVDYATSAFARLQLYQKNGYLTDGKLIATFESPAQPLDGRYIQKVIDRLLK